MKEEKVRSREKISTEVLKPGFWIKKAMWQEWEAEKAKLMGTEAKLADALLKMTLAKEQTVTMQEERMGRECHFKRENWGVVVVDRGGFRNMEEEVAVGQVGGGGVKMGGGRVNRGGKEGKGARVRGSILAAAVVEKNLRNICQLKLGEEEEEGWRGKVGEEATRRSLRTFSAQAVPIFAPGVTQPALCGGTSGSKAGQG